MRHMIASALLTLTVSAAIYFVGYVHGRHSITEPKAPTPDLTPAPAQRQPDNSLVLERAPDPKAKPAHMVPSDARVERVIQVVVQPEPVTLHAEKTTIEHIPAPITLDLTLARMPDGGHRVIASSPDGTILSGVDIPASIPASRKYSMAAGVLWDMDFKNGSRFVPSGAWCHYYRGAMVAGAALRYAYIPNTQGRHLAGELSLGWRW